MLAMIFLPFAHAATSETKFDDGNSTWSHIYTAAGGASTPGVTLPIGALITDAEFNLTGEASTTQWLNGTANQDFGGVGSTSTSWNLNGFYARRERLDIANNDAKLVIQPTTNSLDFIGNLDINSASTTAYHNSTTGYLANGVVDIIPRSKSISPQQFTKSTGWSSAGPSVKFGSGWFIIQNVGSTGSVRYYNASTGGSSSVTLSTNSCSMNDLAGMYDAAIDGDGSVWTISYSNSRIAHWNVSETKWTCSSSTSINSVLGRPHGIAVDPSTDLLWVLTSDSSNYLYLYEVDRTSLTSSNTSFAVGYRTSFMGTVAGLMVQLPRFQIATYYHTSASYHYPFTVNGLLVSQGTRNQVSYGHYGLVHQSDGLLSWAPNYATYGYQVRFEGSSTPFNWHNPYSKTQSIVRGTQISTGGPLQEVELLDVDTFIPSGDSIDLEISSDGGLTWKALSIGGKIKYGGTSTTLDWRAFLNGTTSTTPILGEIEFSITSKYASSGYFEFYQYYWQQPIPLGLRVFWNSTAPVGTTVVAFMTTSFACPTNSPSTPLSNGQYHDLSTWASTTLRICFELRSGTSGVATPILDDFHVALYSNAPSDVSIDIGDDGTKDWSRSGNLVGTVQAKSSTLISALNKAIPGTGTGVVTIPFSVGSQSAGKVSIASFNMKYVMSTVNLDINVPSNETLHAREQPYIVTSRHVIGEDATGGIVEADLRFIANPLPDSPKLKWSSPSSFTEYEDGQDWIEVVPDQSSTEEIGGILEIHWAFRVKQSFPQQSGIAFAVACEDSIGRIPAELSSGPTSLSVNHSYGISDVKVIDDSGLVQRENVLDGEWVMAGETIHFAGDVAFYGTNDAPLDAVYDVQVALNGIADPSWRDRSNYGGSFFISVEMPKQDVPGGIDLSVMTYNEQDPRWILPPTPQHSRTLLIDATPPSVIYSSPSQNDYVEARSDQTIEHVILDSVGDPNQLKLEYWVESVHDINRNGISEENEFINKTMVNSTSAEKKVFETIIDDSRNPNNARVVYRIVGTDQAGNPIIDSPLVTYRSRQDSPTVVLGLEWLECMVPDQISMLTCSKDGWLPHVDGEALHSGIEQSVRVTLVDANGLRDFREIGLTFDFEGPDPERDAQQIAFSGVNQTFWSESSVIRLLQSSTINLATNESGLPLITVDFRFEFGWDWPDEDLGDLSLTIHELGSIQPRVMIWEDHTFSVENDLVFSAVDHLVEDVSTPRIGPVKDGDRIRTDDRLRFRGRVLYQGTSIAPPIGLGIRVSIFDGEQNWLDSSLDLDGTFLVEVPLDASESQAGAPIRTFISRISGIPKNGEDMTGGLVATTLRLEVDRSPPQVSHRIEPPPVLDVSNPSDLTAVPVRIMGWEDAPMIDASHNVHWIMRDGIFPVCAGLSPLSITQIDDELEWGGSIDLTECGVEKINSGNTIGIWVTGTDHAGNPFPSLQNTEADPIRLPLSLAGDNDPAWIKLGTRMDSDEKGGSAELAVVNLWIEDSVVSEGSEIEVRATLTNRGGQTNSTFQVDFSSGMTCTETERFSSRPIVNGLDSGEVIEISATWNAKEGHDRVFVLIDSQNDIPEVNEDVGDNSGCVTIDVAYARGFGWVDSARSSPLPIFAIVGMISVLFLVAIIANRTSPDDLTGYYHDEEDFFDEDSEEEVTEPYQ